MANYVLCFLLFRIVLPIIIGVCIVFRPCGLSALYLIFLLILPLIKVPTASSMTGYTGVYLKILISTSALTTLTQIAFQIVLLAMPPYGHFLDKDKLLEKILRHVGYVRLDSVDIVTAITWLSPEVLLLISSITTYVVSNRWSGLRAVEVTEDESNLPKKGQSERRQFGFLVSLGKYAVLFCMCFAAVLRPSVPGGLYFLVFLTTATWWASYKQLEKGFAIVMRILMVVVVLHILALYGYQLEWSQELLDAKSNYARYVGLTPLYNITGTADARDWVWADAEWATFVNPIALFLLYYVLAAESKVLLKPKSPKKAGAFSRLDGSFSKGRLSRQMSTRLTSNRRLVRSATTRVKWQSATRKVRLMQSVEHAMAGETTPLIRGVSPNKRYGSGSRKSVSKQDSTGSVTVTGDNPDDIPMDELGTTEEVYEPTLLENILYALDSLLQYIIKSSYIGTNIIMMTWSITYHSWITFVLLLWANLLWLVPNQRKSMLRCSPFLVFYAWFLVISAYIYSMDLTDDELKPSEHMEEIGFKRVKVLPCNPLLIKCLFTCTFWITLRQYMQERLAARQSSALADMVAPLQVTVGTATGVAKDQAPGSKFMEKFGLELRKFLTKFWIWGVAITLFVVAITGQRMTAFRILYMILFLVFVLSFQMSFRAWRRMMFGFWLTVIVYSMIMLVLVYTYQFDNFKTYWEKYLHVPEKQQADIGLELYDTKQLFVRLVTPTFFVIITVIQLHYFHKDFMEMSDPKNTSIVSPELDESSLQGGAYASHTNSLKDDTMTSSLRNISNLEPRERYFKLFTNRLQKVLNITYTFLEIHMPKLILLFLMLMCVYDKCAIYLVLVLLIVLACTFGRPMQIFSIYASSFCVSLILLTRMLYQVEGIEPSLWNVTCEYRNVSKIEHIAAWLGFEKVNENNSLPSLVMWNIIYILMVTIWAVVLVRQYNYRVSRGKPTTRAFFMFPKIGRAEADKNLRTFLMYMANYGFYKFGVEICLMATVALIGFRMDAYSVIYSLWLCILFSLNRRTLSKVWNIYLAFIAMLLPLQYVMTVGIPPTLCILFPWDREYWYDANKAEIYRRVQEWAYLLDSEYPPPAMKLICDFILLFFVSRQSVVFRIEKRYAGKDYAGGSNDSVIHHSEDKNFTNPVPDFISYIRSYLDVFKRGVLLSFLWITLAIVFLAGTNRVNLFSVGYLCGAFVFLWQGTDLYLRPIDKIIRTWNCFLGYNVLVILVKTVMQIVGCIFMDVIPEHFRGIIQICGIGCVKKFGDLTTRAGYQNPYPDQSAFVGLAWDGLCFGFMIMQRRIFQSFNFFHMVNEIKAATILASRGAELIEELRFKRMAEQEEQERKVLEKIKAKMDKIKANQQKIQGASYKDTTNHFIAIRSGDYYMFDDLDDEDLDVLDGLEDEEEPAGDLRAPTVSELLSTAMKTDIGTTVRQRSHSEVRRRSSLPAVTRQRSIISTRSQISVPFSAPPTIEEQVPKTVTIVDDRKKKDDDEDEPQPGTSKDDDMSELAVPKYTLCDRLRDYFLFFIVFIESSMNSMTNFLNRYSKDYRYVLRVLSKEKKILKESTDYSIGLRVGTGKIWQPAGSYHSLLRQSRRVTTAQEDVSEKAPNSEESDTKAIATTLPYSPDPSRRKASVLTVPEIRIMAPSLEHGLDSPPNSPSTVSSGRSTPGQMEEYEDTEMSSYDQPAIVRLLLAIWYIVMSRSENVCYFIIFLNQIKTATFLSLPLPLMVFLWGTLTIPRPNKTFWVTIIAYTEVIVLIKCMFQFDIIAWNSTPAKNPFEAPRIIGIMKNDNYAVWDLLLLLVVFFHRFMLKSMGLWKTSQLPAVMLTEGDYNLNADGELEPIAGDTETRMKPKNLSRAKTKMSSVGRKASDLQSLVEESLDSALEDRATLSDFDPDDDRIVTVITEPTDFADNFPAALKMAGAKYVESFKIFFKQLKDPTSRVAVDVYSYMFLCDFFNFFVILIGYNSFGPQQGDEGVSAFVEDNRVPVLFLLMLIVQFTLIIVDRGIFLRKNIVAKIIFQFIQVLFLHIWLFIVFPLITDRNFNSVIPPQMYYMVKGFYLLLSAYQIRCGYPTRILGNFLCKGYNYANMFLFKGFMAIPFLFELRTVMDWMWTDTSMTVFDWIKMEDIFAHIFQLKCNRHVEDEYPQPRGEKKNPWVKYAMGGALLALIIAIIWFPLVFFSLGNAVGEPNPPYDITLEIRIGPYEPVYQMSAQSNSIYSFTATDYDRLLHAYQLGNQEGFARNAINFISNYEFRDIAAIKLSSDSANVWSISPPDRSRMLAEVNSTKPLTVRLEYRVSHRTSKPEDSGVIPDNVEVKIPAVIGDKPNPIRQNLLEMLSGRLEAPSVLLAGLLPKFLKVTNRGTAKLVNQLLLSDEAAPEDATSLRNVSLRLNRTQGTEGTKEWWKVEENCNDLNYLTILKHIPYADCGSIILYTFNDKIFPSTLNILTGGGIIGLYTTLVFVASRFLRGFFSDQCFKIMFEDMPYIDRVLQLCLNIYLVREAREFTLEEDLFAKLVFLFRSPETLIKWTRPPEEVGEDEDPEDA